MVPTRAETNIMHTVTNKSQGSKKKSKVITIVGRRIFTERGFVLCHALLNYWLTPIRALRCNLIGRGLIERGK
jgi:hypothetical protein